MIGLLLAWAGVGYDFSNLLDQLNQLGFFSYVLPFLLLFAVIYAILSQINIFEKNRGAAVIIALAAALLSLQFQIVPIFFQNIFPKFGIGLAILLIGLILVGAFIQGGEGGLFQWIFFGLGGLIFLIVTISSLSDWRFVGSFWWDRYASFIIVAVVVVGAIIGIIVAGRAQSGGGKKS